MSQYLQHAVATHKEKSKGLTTTHQGGEAYEIDAFKRARRFLILGSEGGSFYVAEGKLTAENIESIGQALDIDGRRLIDMIIEISDQALAPKNEPALLALALAASYENKEKPEYAVTVRSYALSVLPKVARTGTHLFHFAAFVDSFRGWGSSLRKGIGNWYLSKSPMALANQVTKYVQRDGWSHADLLRLSHPIPKNEIQGDIFKYVVDGILPTSEGTVHDYLAAVEAVKEMSDPKEIVRLVVDYNLPREVLPTRALNEKMVWDALLTSGQGMPYTAMVRNLATMTKIGLIEQGSTASKFVIDRLHNEEAMKAARMHPIDFIKAKLTYQAGHSMRGDSSWNPVQPITNALESAFYLSFGAVTPTGRRLLTALDVSGSMGAGYVAGVYGFSPRIASAVMAMVNLRVERDVETVGFTHGLVDLKLSPHDSLNEVIRKISGLRFGGTDCALPMKYAQENRKLFDAFFVYTDSETAGYNPSKALHMYRSKSGIYDAKLIVVGMIANQFSIADPTDQYMLDVVGFDSSAPQVMSAFVRGEI